MNKEALADVIDEATNRAYEIALVKGTAPLVISIIVAGVGFVVYEQFLAVLAPVVELFLLEIIGWLVPEISESGYALGSTIIKGKSWKKKNRKRFEDMLE